MGIADLVIWLLVIFIIYAMAWLAWRIIRPKPAPRIVPAPAAAPLPPAGVVQRRWTPSRRREAAAAKDDWDLAFGPTEPSRDEVYARLRDRLSSL